MVRICALGFHVFCGWSVKRNGWSDRWKELYVNEEYAHCCFFQHFHMTTTTHKWEKCIACIFVHGSWTRPCHPKMQACESHCSGNTRTVNIMGRRGKRKISWQELWDKEAFRASFTLMAAYDVLPPPKNLSQWYDEDPNTHFVWLGLTRAAEMGSHWLWMNEKDSRLAFKLVGGI